MSSSSDSRKPPDGRQNGITAISVRGFKSIGRECSIEIRPLTILAGANSSGKSSVMQPLLLLKQTLEATYDPGPLLLDAGNVRFTAADQLLSRLTGKSRAEQFHVGIEVSGNRGLALVFKRRPRTGFAIAKMTYTYRDQVVTLRPGMPHAEIRSVLPPEGRALEDSIRKAAQVRWTIRRMRCFLEAWLESADPDQRPGMVNRWLTHAHHEPFGAMLRGIIHVPALRGNPLRTYRTTAVGPVFPGTFENYLASIVLEWQTTGNPLLRALGQSLAELGLTWKVEAKPVDETQVELRVGRLLHGARGGARDLVSIADVGFGVSQVLPVVVALLTASPGQLVYIEQPEIHLHPRAQVQLAELLAAAARRGVKVIAETHSGLLLLAVQTLVARGDLSPELVKLHWFARDKQGATKVTSADLDKAGAFGDWPEDFGDVELKAQSRFLDASEKRLVEG
jgi:hypothetical protein